MGSRLGSLAALAVLALAAFVSATWDGPVWEDIGTVPERSEERQPGAADPPREGDPVERERPGAGDPPGPDGLPGTAPWAWLVLAIVVGAAVAALMVLRLHFVRRRRELNGDRPLRTGPTPVPDDAAEDEVADLDHELDAALAELAEGEPRNAIVAIWLHLERLLAARAFERGVADTPTEYVERARSSYVLDAAALDDLADLYREARFSTHPLTERHRRRAHRCLLRLRASLRQPQPSAP